MNPGCEQLQTMVQTWRDLLAPAEFILGVGCGERTASKHAAAGKHTWAGAPSRLVGLLFWPREIDPYAFVLDARVRDPAVDLTASLGSLDQIPGNHLVANVLRSDQRCKQCFQSGGRVSGSLASPPGEPFLPGAGPRSGAHTVDTGC